MNLWLQVTNRMACKLRDNEINYLCDNNIYPKTIKQFMDGDNITVQEKYDMVMLHVNPEKNKENLSRSQIHSMIGAIITMKFD